MEGIGVVAHLASETGTGQSMYEVTRYVETNILGTAMLLEECKARRVKCFARLLSSPYLLLDEPSSPDQLP
jgi:dTDP-L-rhamnose 4-epimerase